MLKYPIRIAWIIFYRLQSISLSGMHWFRGLFTFKKRNFWSLCFVIKVPHLFKYWNVSIYFWVLIHCFLYKYFNINEKHTEYVVQEVEIISTPIGSRFMHLKRICLIISRLIGSSITSCSNCYWKLWCSRISSCNA